MFLVIVYTYLHSMRHFKIIDDITVIRSIEMSYSSSYV